MRIFKNYKQTLLLLVSMLIGGIIGFIMKDKAQVLAPFGDLFINMLCVIIVPLIFVSITLSIAKLKPSIVAKLMKNIILVFALMSVISVLVGILSTYSYRFVSQDNNITLSNNTEEVNENTNFIEKTISMISVNDFQKLLSKDNMIALLVFAIIVGFAIYLTKDKNKKIIEFLDCIDSVLINILKIIMLYAPIGIGAYFATLVGSLGLQIATDYIKIFFYYLIISILFAALFYSFIALISGKKLKTFWKESIPVIVASLSTCSSAACLPINIDATKRMEVSDEVGKTTVALGTSFHKDGSVIDSVFKIMFLVYLFNSDISILTIIVVALISSLLISAVPIGGGTISEMFIISVLGFPISSLPILTIIATITDAPATMLNALGDTSASLLVDNLMKKGAIS